MRNAGRIGQSKLLMDERRQSRPWTQNASWEAGRLLIPARWKSISRSAARSNAEALPLGTLQQTVRCLAFFAFFSQTRIRTSRTRLIGTRTEWPHNGWMTNRVNRVV